MIGSRINVWLGFAVFIAGIVRSASGGSSSAAGAEQPDPAGAARHIRPASVRVLVIANETVGGRALLSELKRARRGARAPTSSSSARR